MADRPTSATRVLRMAVVVDDAVSGELHQTKPGSVSVGSSYAADVLVFGPTAPARHPLFDYRNGEYFLDLPDNARGKVKLGKSAMTVQRLRQRYGVNGKCRIKLDPRAKGKLQLGQSTLMFQFAAPKPEPPKLPFPDIFKASIVGMLGMVMIYSQLASASILGPFFAWAALSELPAESELDIDDRFLAIVGQKPKEDEPEEDEEEEEEDELAEEEEEEVVVRKEKRPDPKILKERPSTFSQKAVAQARSVGVARVLGTYGGEGPGTVFDVIQTTDNRLGELMDGGMQTTVEANGPVGELAPIGGDGIDLHGALVATQGLDTGSGPALDDRTDKRERKISGRTHASSTEATGGGDKKALRATIKHRTSALQHCYNKALRTQPDLAGRMAFTIAISVMGTVTRVVVEEDSLGSASVEACTKAKIKGWRFPMEGADEGAEVTFSVVFSGG
jgi:hypothetical protein